MKVMSKHGQAIRRILRQPALSVGEVLLLVFIVSVVCGGALVLLSMEPASAQAVPDDDEEERMMRDFGLIPEAPVDLSPVRVEYTGAPVRIVLGVGTERRVIFDQPFRLGFEPSVSGYFDLEIYDRFLLISALRPVATRAKVQLASGTIVPLDVQAISGAGPAGPLEIAIARETPADSDDEPLVVPRSVLPVAAPAPGYIDLVRYAAQRFYAPERLRHIRPGLRAVPVIQETIRLIRGVNVESTPLASWEEGGLVVTAVRIGNTGRARVRLDPRQVVGSWRAAAFQHSILRPEQTTILYLVSDRPFESALGLHGHHLDVAGAAAPATVPVDAGAATATER